MLRALAIAGVTLLGGCSLLGNDGEADLAAPPMIGSAEPAKAASKSRGKYRFPSEVANLRKEHLAARRKTAAAERPAAASIASASAAASAPPATPQSSPNDAVGPYPSTWANSFVFASPPAMPPTQRLPDVRQAGFGEQPIY
jgi:hypothetical protein